MTSYQKNECLRKLDVYVGNTNSDISASRAKPEVKKLISDVRDQTAQLLAAIINEIPIQ